MASGIEVAQAYVTIIPSMRGMQGEIAEALDADKVGNDAGHEIGEGISSGLSAKAVVIGNVITDAIRTAVSKAVDVGKEIASGVYEGYAANEQLVGGINKLFGEDAARVVNNANQAFMTAGMSANDYMQTVTSFSASLINSLGGDTQEAARLADMAMRDMSDNVNTFGTDAEGVQNAVMGLAKGNYSMLDNLSLGFAGTQQGMVDLINASGVLDHQLESTKDLADVGFGTMLEAIHAVQTDMSITGTTANEAMDTIEGSANATKAAWENVLTSLGHGEGSTVEDAARGLIDALFGTIDSETGAREGGLIENVLGLADRAFYALGSALPGLLDMALDALPPEIGGPLREAFESIGNVVETVAPVVSTAIGAIVTAVGTIAPVVAPLLPIIASALGAVKIVGVITAIVGAVTGFVTTVGSAIAMIGSLPGLIAVVSTALGGPVTIIAAIVGAIVAFIATNEDARNKVIEVWNAIKEAVSNAVSGAVEFVTTAWETATITVSRTMARIHDTIARTWYLVRNTVSSVVSAIVTAISSRLSGIVGTVQNIFNRVKNAIMTPINAAKSAVQTAINKIKSIINGAHLSLPHFKLPHFNINGGKIPWGIGGKGSKPSISVSWYAKGGYVDEATLFGAGEKGGEFIWPSYAPYLDRYADALASKMPGGGINVYLDNLRVNDDEAIRRDVLNLVSDLSRYSAALNAARG